MEEGEIIAGTFKKMDKQRNADNAKRLYCRSIGRQRGRQTNQ